MVDFFHLEYSKKKLNVKLTCVNTSPDNRYRHKSNELLCGCSTGRATAALVHDRFEHFCRVRSFVLSYF